MQFASKLWPTLRQGGIPAKRGWVLHQGIAFLVFQMMDSRAVEIERPRRTFNIHDNISSNQWGMRCLPMDTEEACLRLLQVRHRPYLLRQCLGLPTDIDFPGLSSEIILGHSIFCGQAFTWTWDTPHDKNFVDSWPMRAICPMQSNECAKKLRCATCERLRPKQTSTTKCQAFVGGRAIWRWTSDGHLLLRNPQLGDLHGAWYGGSSY